MTPIIKVQNLSKQYELGEARSRYSTLRESLIDAAKRPLQGLAGKNGKKGTTVWALDDLSFDVAHGDVVGVIGRNGAGKSTLLKVLSRITEPTRGRVELYGRVGSLLEVGTGFHPELTGRENIYLNGAILGMRHAEIDKKFDEIVSFAEIGDFLDTPVKRYSSGMYMRLAFAVSAHLESEILVVDEVLAVGDAEFQKKCLGKMKDVSRAGRTVLFVSHNMNAIQSLCTSCLYLKNGRVESYGKTDNVIAEYLKTAGDNFKSFDGILKWIKIEQRQDTIVVECEYDSETPLDIPHLGFVVSNSLGVPVFGINPTIDRIEPKAERSSKGRVTVVVNQPKLLDGEYWVSIWFGNSRQNFVEVKDALCLEISGMTSQRQWPQTVVGSVLPRCDWTFS